MSDVTKMRQEDVRLSMEEYQAELDYAERLTRDAKMIRREIVDHINSLQERCPHVDTQQRCYTDVGEMVWAKFCVDCGKQCTQ